MILPDYWLPSPPLMLDPQARLAFDHLLTDALAAGDGGWLDYSQPFPKWHFLAYAVEQHALVLHGTGNPDIPVFEPRQANDLHDFGNRKAVYAAGDGIWAMFYAIVDRDRYPMSINNACIRLADAAGAVSEPYYLFSISQQVLGQQPWRSGVVYLLPSETFNAQSGIPFGEYELQVPQFASFAPVKPLARLAVEPDDFPFLTDIRGHDDARLHEYGQAMQSGSPWPS